MIQRFPLVCLGISPWAVNMSTAPQQMILLYWCWLCTAIQTLSQAPAPLPASKPLEALPAGTTAGSDSMDSVMGVGIGLEVRLSCTLLHCDRKI